MTLYAKRKERGLVSIKVTTQASTTKITKCIQKIIPMTNCSVNVSSCRRTGERGTVTERKALPLIKDVVDTEKPYR